ncbi:hypothetical protein ACFY05_41650 [Microtetraspora fusca]|uniref:MFS transporter n=1 Tax=Microtetraspora fusca TaxID=1997 RepID=A0ABW6VJ03_MICFU
MASGNCGTAPIHKRADRPDGTRHSKVGLSSGAGYLTLLAVPPGGTTGSPRRAPSERFGAYFGLLSFLSGAVALAGGFAVGPLFDAGSRGVTTALVGLGLIAAISTAALRLPRSHADDA